MWCHSSLAPWGRHCTLRTVGFTPTISMRDFLTEKQNGKGIYTSTKEYFSTQGYPLQSSIGFPTCSTLVLISFPSCILKATLFVFQYVKSPKVFRAPHPHLWVLHCRTSLTFKEFPSSNYQLDNTHWSRVYWLPCPVVLWISRGCLYGLLFHAYTC